MTTAAAVDRLVHHAGFLEVTGTSFRNEAAKLLLEAVAQSCPPEAETPWERRNGKAIRRQLWRTAKLNGFENSVGNHCRGEPCLITSSRHYGATPWLSKPTEETFPAV